MEQDVLCELIREMAMAQASGMRRTALLKRVTGTDLILYLYNPNFFYNRDDFIRYRDTEYSRDYSPQNYITRSLFPDIIQYERGQRIQPKGALAGLIANNQGEAWEVEYSKAEPETKAGPMMYEIAMGTVGWIMCDRNHVSKEAENVWKKFYNRSDVVHEDLSKKIERYYESARGRPWKNCRFSLKGPGQDTKILESVHKMAVEGFASMASRRESLSPKDVEDMIINSMYKHYVLEF